MLTSITFKVASLGLIGMLVSTILALSFVSMRKEMQAGQPLTGLFPLMLILTTFCILIALLSASA